MTFDIFTLGQAAQAQALLHPLKADQPTTIFRLYTRTTCGRCGEIHTQEEGVFQEQAGKSWRLPNGQFAPIDERRYRDISELTCRACDPHGPLKTAIRRLLSEDKGDYGLPDKVAAMVQAYTNNQK